MNISAIIIANNEEKNIEKCLRSVGFCDEILLIDDFSTDNTVNIAKKMGALVYKRKLEDFSRQRNFALEKAQGRWCLFVDADEIVTEKLKNEIINKINIESNPVTGYFIRREDFFKGKLLNYGESGGIYLLRLARKSAGKWQRKVHEYWNILGKTEKLENHILHYPHPSLKEFINEVNKYSSWHAEANNNDKKKSSLFKIIFFPPAKFINNFVFKLGFLDGETGFIATLMMSLHSYLAWSKLWLIQKRQFPK